MPILILAQVVTASGGILNVTASTDSDQFWALRGGGNNFGIVTRFAYRILYQGLMWGGQRYALPSERAAGIKAYVNFGFNSSLDPKAALIYVFGYAEGMFLNAVSLEYADPVPTTPGIFSEF